MVGISVTGLEKDPFRRYQAQSEGLRNVLDFLVGVLTTCRTLEVSAEAAARSSKEMAKSEISQTGRGKVLSRQLLRLQHLYRRVVAKEAEMDRVSAKHRHRGERADRRKGLGLQDASSRRNQL